MSTEFSPSNFGDRSNKKQFSAVQDFIPDCVGRLLLKQLERSSRTIDTPITESYRCGIILFLDIVGFTSITESLVSRGEGSGAESLAFCLNRYFELLVRCTSRFGGDVVSFAGDALTALWPVGEDPNLDYDEEVDNCARRAIQCAQNVQQELHDASFIPGVSFRVRIGLGMGPCSLLMLGSIKDSHGEAHLQYILVGPSIQDALDCEKFATPGGIVVSSKLWDVVAPSFLAEPVPNSPSPMMLIISCKAPLRAKRVNRGGILIPSNPEMQETYENLLNACVPISVLQHLSRFMQPYSSELRTVTVAFFNLSDFELKMFHRSVRDTEDSLKTRGESSCESSSDESVEENTLVASQSGTIVSTASKKQALKPLYMSHVRSLNEVVKAALLCQRRHSGSINKLVVDDKGTSLLVVFGLAPHAHENDPERAVYAALETVAALQSMRSKSSPRGVSVSVGLTTGVAFCGGIGARSRREYTILGDICNTAARLMVAATRAVYLHPRSVTTKQSRNSMSSPSSGVDSSHSPGWISGRLSVQDDIQENSGDSVPVTRLDNFQLPKDNKADDTSKQPPLLPQSGKERNGYHATSARSSTHDVDNSTGDTISEGTHRFRTKHTRKSLQIAEGPIQVLVDQSTMRSAESSASLRFIPVQPLHLKGKAGAVPAFVPVLKPLRRIPTSCNGNMAVAEDVVREEYVEEFCRLSRVKKAVSTERTRLFLFLQIRRFNEQATTLNERIIRVNHLQLQKQRELTISRSKSCGRDCSNCGRKGSSQVHVKVQGRPYFPQFMKTPTEDAVHFSPLKPPKDFHLCSYCNGQEGCSCIVLPFSEDKEKLKMDTARDSFAADGSIHKATTTSAVGFVNGGKTSVARSLRKFGSSVRRLTSVMALNNGHTRTTSRGAGDEGHTSARSTSSNTQRAHSLPIHELLRRDSGIHVHTAVSLLPDSPHVQVSNSSSGSFIEVSRQRSVSEGGFLRELKHPPTEFAAASFHPTTSTSAYTIVSTGSALTVGSGGIRVLSANSSSLGRFIPSGSQRFIVEATEKSVEQMTTFGPATSATSTSTGNKSSAGCGSGGILRKRSSFLGNLSPNIQPTLSDSIAAPTNTLSCTSSNSASQSSFCPQESHSHSGSTTTTVEAPFHEGARIFAASVQERAQPQPQSALKRLGKSFRSSISGLSSFSFGSQNAGNTHGTEAPMNMGPQAKNSSAAKSRISDTNPAVEEDEEMTKLLQELQQEVFRLEGVREALAAAAAAVLPPVAPELIYPRLHLADNIDNPSLHHTEQSMFHRMIRVGGYFPHSHHASLVTSSLTFPSLLATVNSVEHSTRPGASGSSTGPSFGATTPSIEGTGGSLMLLGEAGIGKSRSIAKLVYLLYARFRARLLVPLPVCSANGDVIGRVSGTFSTPGGEPFEEMTAAALYPACTDFGEDAMLKSLASIGVINEENNYNINLGLFGKDESSRRIQELDTRIQEISRKDTHLNPGTSTASLQQDFSSADDMENIVEIHDLYKPNVTRPDPNLPSISSTGASRTNGYFSRPSPHVSSGVPTPHGNPGNLGRYDSEIARSCSAASLRTRTTSPLCTSPAPPNNSIFNPLGRNMGPRNDSEVIDAVVGKNATAGGGSVRDISPARPISAINDYERLDGIGASVQELQTNQSIGDSSSQASVEVHINPSSTTAGTAQPLDTPSGRLSKVTCRETPNKNLYRALEALRQGVAQDRTGSVFNGFPFSIQTNSTTRTNEATAVNVATKERAMKSDGIIENDTNKSFEVKPYVSVVDPSTLTPTNYPLLSLATQIHGVTSSSHSTVTVYPNSSCKVPQSSEDSTNFFNNSTNCQNYSLLEKQNSSPEKRMGSQCTGNQSIDIHRRVFGASYTLPSPLGNILNDLQPSRPRPPRMHIAMVAPSKYFHAPSTAGPTRNGRHSLINILRNNNLNNKSRGINYNAYSSPNASSFNSHSSRRSSYNSPTRTSPGSKYSRGTRSINRFANSNYHQQQYTYDPRVSSVILELVEQLLILLQQPEADALPSRIIDELTDLLSSTLVRARVKGDVSPEAGADSPVMVEKELARHVTRKDTSNMRTSMMNSVDTTEEVVLPGEVPLTGAEASGGFDSPSTVDSVPSPSSSADPRGERSLPYSITMDAVHALFVCFQAFGPHLPLLIIIDNMHLGSEMDWLAVSALCKSLEIQTLQVLVTVVSRPMHKCQNASGLREQWGASFSRSVASPDSNHPCRRSSVKTSWEMNTNTTRGATTLRRSSSFGPLCGGALMVEQENRFSFVSPHYLSLFTLSTLETYELLRHPPESTVAEIAYTLQVPKSAVPPELFQLVWRMSGGHPLYARRFSKALFSTGIVRVARSRSKVLDAVRTTKTHKHVSSKDHGHKNGQRKSSNEERNTKKEKIKGKRSRIGSMSFHGSIVGRLRGESQNESNSKNTGVLNNGSGGWIEEEQRHAVSESGKSKSKTKGNSSFLLRVRSKSKSKSDALKGSQSSRNLGDVAGLENNTSNSGETGGRMGRKKIMGSMRSLILRGQNSEAEYTPQEDGTIDNNDRQGALSININNNTNITSRGNSNRGLSSVGSSIKRSLARRFSTDETFQKKFPTTSMDTISSPPPNAVQIFPNGSISARVPMMVEPREKHLLMPQTESEHSPAYTTGDIAKTNVFSGFGVIRSRRALSVFTSKRTIVAESTQVRVLNDFGPRTPKMGLRNRKHTGESSQILLPPQTPEVNKNSGESENGSSVSGSGSNSSSRTNIMDPNRSGDSNLSNITGTSGPSTKAESPSTLNTPVPVSSSANHVGDITGSENRTIIGDKSSHSHISPSPVISSALVSTSKGVGVFLVGKPVPLGHKGEWERKPSVLMNNVNIPNLDNNEIPLTSKPSWKHQSGTNGDGLRDLAKRTQRRLRSILSNKPLSSSTFSGSDSRSGTSEDEGCTCSEGCDDKCCCGCGCSGGESDSTCSACNSVNENRAGGTYEQWENNSDLPNKTRSELLMEKKNMKYNRNLGVESQSDSSRSLRFAGGKIVAGTKRNDARGRHRSESDTGGGKNGSESDRGSDIRRNTPFRSSQDGKSNLLLSSSRISLARDPSESNSNRPIAHGNYISNGENNTGVSTTGVRRFKSRLSFLGRSRSRRSTDSIISAYTSNINASPDDEASNSASHPHSPLRAYTHRKEEYSSSNMLKNEAEKKGEVSKAASYRQSRSRSAISTSFYRKKGKDMDEDSSHFQDPEASLGTNEQHTHKHSKTQSHLNSHHANHKHHKHTHKDVHSRKLSDRKSMKSGPPSDVDLEPDSKNTVKEQLRDAEKYPLVTLQLRHDELLPISYGVQRLVACTLDSLSTPALLLAKAAAAICVGSSQTCAIFTAADALGAMPLPLAQLPINQLFQRARAFGSFALALMGFVVGDPAESKYHRAPAVSYTGLHNVYNPGTRVNSQSESRRNSNSGIRAVAPLQLSSHMNPAVAGPSIHTHLVGETGIPLSVEHCLLSELCAFGIIKCENGMCLDPENHLVPHNVTNNMFGGSIFNRNGSVSGIGSGVSASNTTYADGLPGSTSRTNYMQRRQSSTAHTNSTLKAVERVHISSINPQGVDTSIEDDPDFNINPKGVFKVPNSRGSVRMSESLIGTTRVEGTANLNEDESKDERGGAKVNEFLGSLKYPDLSTQNPHNSTHHTSTADFVPNITTFPGNRNVFPHIPNNGICRCLVFRFDSGIMRDIIYNLTPSELRQTLHRRAAEQLAVLLRELIPRPPENINSIYSSYNNTAGSVNSTLTASATTLPTSSPSLSPISPPLSSSMTPLITKDGGLSALYEASSAQMLSGTVVHLLASALLRTPLVSELGVLYRHLIIAGQKDSATILFGLLSGSIHATPISQLQHYMSIPIPVSLSMSTSVWGGLPHSLPPPERYNIMSQQSQLHPQIQLKNVEMVDSNSGDGSEINKTNIVKKKGGTRGFFQLFGRARSRSGLTMNSSSQGDIYTLKAHQPQLPQHSLQEQHIPKQDLIQSQKSQLLPELGVERTTQMSSHNPETTDKVTMDANVTSTVENEVNFSRFPSRRSSELIEADSYRTSNTTPPVSLLMNPIGPSEQIPEGDNQKTQYAPLVLTPPMRDDRNTKVNSIDTTFIHSDIAAGHNVFSKELKSISDPATESVSGSILKVKAPLTKEMSDLNELLMRGNRVFMDLFTTTDSTIPPVVDVSTFRLPIPLRSSRKVLGISGRSYRSDVSRLSGVSSSTSPYADGKVDLLPLRIPISNEQLLEYANSSTTPALDSSMLGIDPTHKITENQMNSERTARGGMGLTIDLGKTGHLLEGVGASVGTLEGQKLLSIVRDGNGASDGPTGPTTMRPAIGISMGPTPRRSSAPEFSDLPSVFRSGGIGGILGDDTSRKKENLSSLGLITVRSGSLLSAGPDSLPSATLVTTNTLPEQTISTQPKELTNRMNRPRPPFNLEPIRSPTHPENEDIPGVHNVYSLQFAEPRQSNSNSYPLMVPHNLNLSDLRSTAPPPPTEDDQATRKGSILQGEMHKYNADKTERIEVNTGPAPLLRMDTHRWLPRSALVRSRRFSDPDLSHINPPTALSPIIGSRTFSLAPGMNHATIGFRSRSRSVLADIQTPLADLQPMVPTMGHGVGVGMPLENYLSLVRTSPGALPGALAGEEGLGWTRRWQRQEQQQAELLAQQIQMRAQQQRQMQLLNLWEGHGFRISPQSSYDIPQVRGGGQVNKGQEGARESGFFQRLGKLLRRNSSTTPFGNIASSNTGVLSSSKGCGSSAGIEGVEVPSPSRVSPGRGPRHVDPNLIKELSNGHNVIRSKLKQSYQNPYNSSLPTLTVEHVYGYSLTRDVSIGLPNTPQVGSSGFVEGSQVIKEKQGIMSFFSRKKFKLSSKSPSIHSVPPGASVDDLNGMNFASTSKNYYFVPNSTLNHNYNANSTIFEASGLVEGQARAARGQIPILRRRKLFGQGSDQHESFSSPAIETASSPIPHAPFAVRGTLHGESAGAVGAPVDISEWKHAPNIVMDDTFKLPISRTDEHTTQLRKGSGTANNAAATMGAGALRLTIKNGGLSALIVMDVCAQSQPTHESNYNQLGSSTFGVGFSDNNVGNEASKNGNPLNISEIEVNLAKLASLNTENVNGHSIRRSSAKNDNIADQDSAVKALSLLTSISNIYPEKGYLSTIPTNSLIIQSTPDLLSNDCVPISASAGTLASYDAHQTNTHNRHKSSEELQIEDYMKNDPSYDSLLRNIGEILPLSMLGVTPLNVAASSLSFGDFYQSMKQDTPIISSFERTNGHFLTRRGGISPRQPSVPLGANVAKKLDQFGVSDFSQQQKVNGNLMRFPSIFATLDSAEAKPRTHVQERRSLGGTDTVGIGDLLGENLKYAEEELALTTESAFRDMNSSSEQNELQISSEGRGALTQGNLKEDNHILPMDHNTGSTNVSGRTATTTELETDVGTISVTPRSTVLLGSTGLPSTLGSAFFGSRTYNYPASNNDSGAVKSSLVDDFFQNGYSSDQSPPSHTDNGDLPLDGIIMSETERRLVIDDDDNAGNELGTQYLFPFLVKDDGNSVPYRLPTEDAEELYVSKEADALRIDGIVDDTPIHTRDGLSNISGNGNFTSYNRTIQVCTSSYTNRSFIIPTSHSSSGPSLIVNDGFNSVSSPSERKAIESELVNENGFQILNIAKPHPSATFLAFAEEEILNDTVTITATINSDRSTESPGSSPLVSSRSTATSVSNIRDSCNINSKRNEQDFTDDKSILRNESKNNEPYNSVQEVGNQSRGLSVSTKKRPFLSLTMPHTVQNTRILSSARRDSIKAFQTNYFNSFGKRLPLSVSTTKTPVVSGANPSSSQKGWKTNVKETTEFLPSTPSLLSPSSPSCGYINEDIATADSAVVKNVFISSQGTNSKKDLINNDQIPVYLDDGEVGAGEMSLSLGSTLSLLNPSIISHSIGSSSEAVANTYNMKHNSHFRSKSDPTSDSIHQSVIRIVEPQALTLPLQMTLPPLKQALPRPQQSQTGESKEDRRSTTSRGFSSDKETNKGFYSPVFKQRTMILAQTLRTSLGIGFNGGVRGAYLRSPVNTTFSNKSALDNSSKYKPSEVGAFHTEDCNVNDSVTENGFFSGNGGPTRHSMFIASMSSDNNISGMEKSHPVLTGYSIGSIGNSVNVDSLQSNAILTPSSTSSSSTSSVTRLFSSSNLSLFSSTGSPVTTSAANQNIMHAKYKGSQSSALLSSQGSIFQANSPRRTSTINNNAPIYESRRQGPTNQTNQTDAVTLNNSFESLNLETITTGSARLRSSGGVGNLLARKKKERSISGPNVIAVPQQQQLSKLRLVALKALMLKNFMSISNNSNNNNSVTTKAGGKEKTYAISGKNNGKGKIWSSRGRNGIITVRQIGVGEDIGDNENVDNSGQNTRIDRNGDVGTVGGDVAAADLSESDDPFYLDVHDQSLFVDQRSFLLSVSSAYSRDAHMKGDSSPVNSSEIENPKTIALTSEQHDLGLLIVSDKVRNRLLKCSQNRLYNSAFPLLPTTNPIHQQSTSKIRRMGIDSFCTGQGNTVSEWDFNVFVLGTRQKSSPLVAMTSLILNDFQKRWMLPDPQVNLSNQSIGQIGYNVNVNEGIQPVQRVLSGQVIEVFLSAADTIERGYFDIPYHNALHAADVTQKSYALMEMLLESDKEALRSLSIQDRLIVILSAMMHDHGHPGYSDAFLRAVDDPLAQRFAEPVLEHMHLATAFAALRHKKQTRNLMKLLSESQEDFTNIIKDDRFDIETYSSLKAEHNFESIHNNTWKKAENNVASGSQHFSKKGGLSKVATDNISLSQPHIAPIYMSPFSSSNTSVGPILSETSTDEREKSSKNERSLAPSRPNWSSNSFHSPRSKQESPSEAVLSGHSYEQSLLKRSTISVQSKTGTISNTSCEHNTPIQLEGDKYTDDFERESRKAAASMAQSKKYPFLKTAAARTIIEIVLSTSLSQHEGWLQKARTVFDIQVDPLTGRAKIATGRGDTSSSTKNLNSTARRDATFRSASMYGKDPLANAEQEGDVEQPKVDEDLTESPIRFISPIQSPPYSTSGKTVDASSSTSASGTYIGEGLLHPPLSPQERYALEKTLAMQMIVKAADVGNPCARLVSSRLWSRLISQEFSQQREAEVLHGVVVSVPVTESSKMLTFATGQVFFISKICLPLFKIVDILSPSTGVYCYQRALHRYFFWKNITSTLQNNPEDKYKNSCK